ncbi:unnamed protein product [Periconia digitata]|uniref:Uncharacterized protein n=1 Tax=Periconia digitata TaxID=1303443 RepID=A0A9W4U4I8_9PLEO|nr:unnamed protein product [Periconia digitata]
MRSYIAVSALVAAVAAQGSSSADSFPQTAFLTQTNSNGVVTGQPGVATSQPAAATNQPVAPPADSSQPPVVTIPAVGTTGIHTITQGVPGTNSTVQITVSASNTTTSVLGELPSGVSSVAGGSGASGSNGARPTPSGSGSNPSGSGAGSSGPSGSGNAAAPTMKAMAGSLLGAGAFVAAFL